MAVPGVLKRERGDEMLRNGPTAVEDRGGWAANGLLQGLHLVVEVVDVVVHGEVLLLRLHEALQQLLQVVDAAAMPQPNSGLPRSDPAEHIADPRHEGTKHDTK